MCDVWMLHEAHMRRIAPRFLLHMIPTGVVRRIASGIAYAINHAAMWCEAPKSYVQHRMIYSPLVGRMM